jgi:FtsP/CotA-like multicopper oxidase with cupredoxin domain
MTLLHAGLPLSLVAAAMLAHSTARPVTRLSSASVERVVVNDNRRPAGTLHAGVLTLRLDARLAEWHPDGDAAAGAVVPAFAEEGGPARIPGPLIRVPAGTRVALTVRNSLARPLTLRGLHDRGRGAIAATAGILELAPGVSRDVSFVLEAPGVYYYYGSTSGQTIDWRADDSAQLSGAIVVDPPDAPPPKDRILVLGVWSDTAGRTLAQRKRILATVNGRSWPFTERFDFAVGDSVRWHVVNASADAHPMHLHGFYYRIDGRGDGRADTVYAPGERRLVNTELLSPGTTFTMTWVPERPGNWLFHCHLPDHFSARGPLGMLRSIPDAMAGHGAMNHARTGMSGMILGITVRGVSAFAVQAGAVRRADHVLRLLVRPSAGGSATQPYYAFALEKEGVEPPPDSGLRTGDAIVVTRDEPVRITVVNALDVPTSVHWHGIELESYFDGVAGFSGAGRRLAPVIAPHDSFVARFTPPRAGTFIYHTHVDETRQQLAGLAGPLIVLEPGGRLDTTTDHSIVITTPPVWEDELRSVLLNARAAPAPLVVRAGVAQRLRLINMTTRRPTSRVELWRDSTMLSWRMLEKDGADLPVPQRAARPARSNVSIGETLDVEFVPTAGGNSRLEVHGANGALLARMPIRVLAGP